MTSWAYTAQTVDSLVLDKNKAGQFLVYSNPILFFFQLKYNCFTWGPKNQTWLSDWTTIALQGSVSFCCTMKWINHEKWKLLSHVWLFVPHGYTVHGILQARILEWVVIPFSKVSSQTQALNPGLLHCRQILYQLRYKGSPNQPYVYIYPLPIEHPSHSTPIPPL